MAWTVSTENRGAIPEHFRPFVVLNEAGDVVCRMPDGRSPMDKAIAENIAAAPEFKAALRELLKERDEIAAMLAERTGITHTYHAAREGAYAVLNRLP